MCFFVSTNARDRASVVPIIRPKRPSSIAKPKSKNTTCPGLAPFDRCAGGPVMVIYPEAVWYTYVDHSDIDEIIESHLIKGQVVERLRLPDDVGH
jgi:(2Fe-2S) ferredoxin